MSLQPVYLDNHLLVLFKPPGALSQADETGDPDLLSQGKAYIKSKFAKPGNVYLGLVHRLDRPASGLVVFARTSKAAARLTAAFRERKVEKGYLAIVEGRLDGEGAWRDHLVKDSRQVRIVPDDHPKGKLARLRWRALAHERETTLVAVTLLTGRAHQIRVQFASRGHALLGDLRYGATRPFDGANLALHSYLLAFDHPVGGRPLRFLHRPPATWGGWFTTAVATLPWDD